MEKFNKTIQDIQNQLLQPLAGFNAHIQMMPEIRKKNIPIEKPNNTTRSGAVLILLYPNKEEINTVLIHRNTYKGVHSDQMAFPGGKYEQNDHSLSITALREANEEIGVPISEVEIIGALTKIFIPPSNFEVQPFVGYIKYKPQFIAQEREVKAIVEIPIKEFLNSQNIKKTDICINNYILYDVPCWEIENNIIWGATAMILSEFCEVLNAIPEL